MMKKLVVLIASLGLAVQLSGCSLFSSENKSDAEVTADVDSADLEKLEGDEALLAADNSSLASDQLPEDALGESAPKAESQAIAAAPATPAPVETTSNEALPADPFAENTAAAEVAPPPAESNTTIVDSGTTTTPETVPMLESTTTTTAAVETPAPKKASASLQKVATAPWKVGKTWFNTVYFARPGDSLASISQMIYGADKTAELKKGNATFKSRSVKPGDKVYYNSPHRPDDSARMITFYEDNGIAPEVYVAKSGDNIRKVSKDLLGYPNAWKEVWATNSIDSKDAIPEGTELHFWKGGNVAAAPAPAAPSQPDMQMAPPAAQEMPAAPSELAAQAPQGEAPHQAQAEIPPPPPMPEQAPEMAPPPPPPDMAQNQMAPPPPPPPAEAINPPPPPQKKHQMEEAPAGGMDNDTTLALAVVGLAAAGLAGLIVMRKKRKQKEAEQQAMEHTHVGT